MLSVVLTKLKQQLRKLLSKQRRFKRLFYHLSITSMLEQYTLNISVFSNESMTECLDSYESDGLISDIEHDLLDDEDWWYEYADDAEDKFGSKWSTILIKSLDESQARLIDRNYYLNGVINNNNFVYHDKLFLVGKSSSQNLGIYFSGHLIFNYKLSEIHSVKSYLKGNDETLIALIDEFTSVMYGEAKVVDVIFNPSPKSILMMKLSEHYKFMVHIPTKDKVNELIGLKKSLNFTGRIYQDMLEARRIANGYGTSELNFMMPLIDEIESKIYPESDNSYYRTFEEKFCI